ncbi:MAG: MFS transporter [Candidatus Hydrogenedentes bacterium]|nr:MFS transporter [Candidatus Hydrogenedentota bacterium]
MTTEAPLHAPPDRIKRAQIMVLIAAFLGWLFDGFEMGLFPFVARPALTSMFPGAAGVDMSVVDQFVGEWMGYITALFLLGAATGGWLFGWLGDKIGRVRAMSLSILTYSIFTGMGYFAGEPWHLGAFRFLAALGMGGEWSLGVALVMEVWPEKFRPLMAGLIGAAANFGFLLVGYVGNLLVRMAADSGEPDPWRAMWLVGVLPALLVFFIRLFVPESKRWQQSVIDHKDNAPLREIFEPQRLRNTLLGIAFASVALIGTWGTVQWIPLWIDQMTGQSIPDAKGTAIKLSAVGAIIGCLVGPILGGIIGRRPTYFLLCLSSLVTCGYMYLANLEYGLTLQLLILLTGFTTAAFYGWFPLFLPELFPTRMRATGQGVCYNTGRVFAAFGAVFGGQLVKSFGGDYARAGSIIILVYLVGMAIIWLAPETKGHALPD